MKSVIAQGATIAKAIEEALKKAEMPQEFFVKVLEVGQSSFLGFGGKKAKIALFFRQHPSYEKDDRFAYQNFFDNPKIRQQIDAYLQEVGVVAGNKSQQQPRQERSAQPKRQASPEQQQQQRKVQPQQSQPRQDRPAQPKPQPQQQPQQNKPTEFVMRPLSPAGQEPVDGEQRPKRRRRRYYGRRRNGDGSNAGNDNSNTPQ